MLKKYLKPHIIFIINNTLLALLLGAISSYLIAYIGRVAFLLMNRDKAGSLDLAGFLGDKTADVVLRVWPGLAGHAFDRWFDVGVLIVSLSLFRAILNTAHWYRSEVVGEKVSLRVRDDLMSSFMRVNPRERASFTMEEGELSAALTQDVRVLREYIVHFYGGFVRELFQVLFFTGTLIYLSPKMFVILVAGAVPIVAVIQKLGKKIKRRASQALNDYSKMAEWLQQRLLGIETIKQFRGEKLEINNMHVMADSLYKGFYRAAKVKAKVSPVIEALSVFIFAGVLWITIRDVNAGAVSGMDMFAFFSTLSMLAQSGSKVGKYYNSNKEGHAAVDRIQTFFEAFEKNREVAPSWLLRKTMPGKVLEVVNLSVSYGGVPAVQDVTLSVGAGEWVSICGQSGSGKTTLMNALLGLVNVQGGSIAWGEKAEVGFLSQQIHLLAGSVGENLAYPDGEFEEERAWNALRRVGLEGFFRDKAAGLGTVLGRNGLTLSGGQEQRIMLARLFYRKFTVVCVDEGTSALDEATEQLIIRGLRELVTAGTSVIMVAHRVHALMASDRLCGMRYGKMEFLESTKDVPRAILDNLFRT